MSIGKTDTSERGLGRVKVEVLKRGRSGLSQAASGDLAGHGRAIGLVGLIGLAILLGGSVLVAFDLRGQMRRDATQELRSTAYLLADHASRLFEVADVALRGATAATEGQDWDTIQHSEDLARQLRTTRSALPYVEMSG